MASSAKETRVNSPRRKTCLSGRLADGHQRKSGSSGQSDGRLQRKTASAGHLQRKIASAGLQIDQRGHFCAEDDQRKRFCAGTLRQRTHSTVFCAGRIPVESSLEAVLRRRLHPSPATTHLPFSKTLRHRGRAGTSWVGMILWSWAPGGRFAGVWQTSGGHLAGAWQSASAGSLTSLMDVTVGCVRRPRRWGFSSIWGHADLPPS
jgi:hypothetical protein